MPELNFYDFYMRQAVPASPSHTHNHTIHITHTLKHIHTHATTHRPTHAPLELEQEVEQTGFKRNFSTNDNIFTLKQLNHQCEPYNFRVFLIFLDFEKAYDSVQTSAILTAFKEAGVNRRYRDIVEYIYKRSGLVERMDGE